MFLPLCERPSCTPVRGKTAVKIIVLCILISLFANRTRHAVYRDADKSLARPWKETSYSDQDLQHWTKTYNTIPRLTTLYQDLQHYTKTYNTEPRLTTLYQDLQHYTKTYNTIPRLTTLNQDLQHWTKTNNTISRLTTLYQDLWRTNNSNIFLCVRLTTLPPSWAIVT